MDTIKVRQQMRTINYETAKNSRVSTLHDMPSKVSLKRQIKKLFRGLSFPLISEGLRQSIFFGTYGKILIYSLYLKEKENQQIKLNILKAEHTEKYQINTDSNSFKRKLSIDFEQNEKMKNENNSSSMHDLAYEKNLKSYEEKYLALNALSNSSRIISIISYVQRLLTWQNKDNNLNSHHSKKDIEINFNHTENYQNYLSACVETELESSKLDFSNTNISSTNDTNVEDNNLIHLKDLKDSSINNYKDIKSDHETQQEFQNSIDSIHIRDSTTKFPIDDSINISYTTIAIAAGIGGGFQAILATPVELVKINMQYHSANAHHAYQSPIRFLSKVYTECGLGGLFKGLNITILREVPAYSTYMLTYIYTRNWFAKSQGTKNPHIIADLFSGGLAGIFSWSINMPIDVIKTRLQSDSLPGKTSIYSGIWDCVVKCYKKEGLRVFWKGMTVTCIRAFPTNAVTLVAYTKSLEFLNNFLSY